MTGYARGTLAMNRVILRIDPANHASIPLAEAAGFSLTAGEPVIRERRGRQETLLTWFHGTSSQRIADERRNGRMMGPVTASPLT